MMARKKSKKSVVPRKLQVPLAILLGIVFIFLLKGRLSGRSAAEGEAAPAARDEVVTAEVGPTDSERRVDDLIDKITQDEPEPEREVLPRLAGDPFAKPPRPAARVSGTPDAHRHEQDDAYDGRSRDQFVEGLNLQATLIDGDKRFVLINGMLFAEKDRIGAFKIVEIGERAASLRDDRGSVLLKMKGDDLS
jgi:hypothetical protein